MRCRYVRADEHTLATREPGAFDRDLPLATSGPSPRRLGFGEDGELGGRNAGAHHQLFGERLARLDTTSAPIGAEHVESRLAQRIAHPRLDRGLGTQNDETESFAFGEIDDPRHIRGADGNVSRHAAGAAVAGRAVDALDQVGLHTFPDERVLTGARTDDEDLQPIPTRWCREAST